MYKAIEIKITRIEGNSETVVLRGDKLFGRASETLFSWASTAPTIGYHKCDVEITFDNKEAHKIRYDLYRGKNHFLTDQIKWFLSFYLGEAKPSFWSEDSYKRILDRSPNLVLQAKNWKENYKFED